MKTLQQLAVERFGEGGVKHQIGLLRRRLKYAAEEARPARFFPDEYEAAGKPTSWYVARFERLNALKPTVVG